MSHINKQEKYYIVSDIIKIDVHDEEEKKQT